MKKTLSAEHRIKIGLANKRRVISAETREKHRQRMLGVNNHNFGKKFSPETLAKMRSAQSGEKSSAWKGGLWNSIEYRNWLKNKQNRLKHRVLGDHSFKEWLDLKKKYNNECLWCHRKEPVIQLTEDHIIALSMGGSDNINNIQPLCKSCNSKKHTKTVDFRNSTMEAYI